jgi:hypothetical protein
VRRTTDVCPVATASTSPIRRSAAAGRPARTARPGRRRRGCDPHPVAELGRPAGQHVRA